jgi:Uma2 family endonuclease
MRPVERVKPRVSYADLQRMPEDGNRYELYDGELYVVPSPLPFQQIVLQRFCLILHRYSQRRGGLVFLAPFDIVLSDYNVVQPDLIYFGPQLARRIRPDEHVRFAPDLAIEVLSPSTAANDRGRKRNLMARYRVPEYWVVDPAAKRIDVSTGHGPAYGEPLVVSSGRCRAQTVEGLQVSMSALLRELHS